MGSKSFFFFWVVACFNLLAGLAAPLPHALPYVFVGREGTGGSWWGGFSNGTTISNKFLTYWSTDVTWVDGMKGDFNGDEDEEVVGRDLAAGNWWVGRYTPSGFVNELWATWDSSLTWVDSKTGDFNRMEITIGSMLCL